MKPPKYLVLRGHPQFAWVAYRVTYSVALESFKAFSYGLVSYVGLEVYGLTWYSDALIGAHIGISVLLAWYFGSNVSQTNVIEPRSIDIPCFHPAIPTTLMFLASSGSFILPRVMAERLFGTEQVVSFVVDNVPGLAFLLFCNIYGATYFCDKLFRKQLFGGLPILPGRWLSKMLADCLSNVFRKSVSKRRQLIGLSIIGQNTTDKQYLYSEIGSRMIRLLKIQAIPVKDKAQCEVITVSLDEAPSYDAVSYRWGDPTPVHSLLVDDMTIPITQSVHDLLLTFCPTEGTRYLFIDAVCIDQANLTEKAQQIPLMGEIYEKANEVVIFLGQDEDAARACNFAHCIVSDLLETIDVNKGRWKQDLPANIEPAKKDLPFRSDVRGWQAFTRLLENEYWSRTWIIQEIVLSKRLRIQYGEATLSWICIGAIIRWYYWRPKRPAPNSSMASYTTTVDSAIVRETYLRAIMLARGLQIIQGRNRSLPTLVNLFCRHSVTKPEDKVYGHLGLATDSQARELQPDYNLSVWEVYARLTTYELRSGAFGMLNMAGLSKPRPGPDISLPSWVPDLRNPQPIATTMGLWGLDTRGYNAGGDQAPRFEVIQGGRVLKIRGSSIDNICAVTPLSHQYETAMAMSSVWIEAAGTTYRDQWRARAVQFDPTAHFLEAAAKICFENVPDYYPAPSGIGSKIDRTDAFWRTLCLDFDGTNHPASQAMVHSWHDFVAQTARGAALFSPETGVLQNHWTFGDLATFWKYQVSGRWGKQFDDSFESWWGSGRQFAVSVGGYMAIVPAGTEAGDVLCVFDGLLLPYVLRPLTSPGGKVRYNLWGEAFVYGVMRGEVAGRSDEWFEIS